MAGISFVSMPAPPKSKEYFNDGQHEITPTHDIKPDLASHSDHSSSTQSSEVSELRKYNKELEDENQSLKVEMQNFEHKLSYLEYTLGVIDDDSIGDSSTFIDSQHLCVGGITTPTIPTPVSTENSNIVQGSEGGDKLDKSAAIGDEIIDHPKEIQRLQSKNKQMLTAIKALAKAALCQKEKHDLYKSKSNVAKKEVSTVNKKLTLMLLEKQKVQSSYLETRSLFLEEKDKKDELQDEINLLALQLKSFTATCEEEMVDKKRILQQLEEEVEDTTVLPLSGGNGDGDSGSVRVELMRKTEIISQLQSKIALVRKYMKKIIDNNKSDKRHRVRSEINDVVILANKAVTSTSEAEI